MNTKLNGKFSQGKIVHFHFHGDRERLGNELFIAALLRAIIQEIEMTPHGDVEFHKYPVEELGFTATACVAVQHLHESYVIYDNWIEYDPAYANIIVNSCLDYDHHLVERVIKRLVKPVSFRISGLDYYQPEPEMDSA